MSTQPALSVVVPFYGVEDYLRECLESLQTQTLDDMQVVLVDDGSPDRSIEIAEEFTARDARFQLVRQANAGLGPARNTGHRHAVGRYVTFLDSDDIVPRRAYEMMVDSLHRTGSSFAVGNARRFSRTSGVRQSWAHSRPCARDRIATHIIEHPNLAYDRMVWNKVYRADFYEAHAYEFPPIKYEDWPVTMRAHLEALTVDVMQAPTYYWRERESGDSITQQVFKYDNLLDRVISAEQVMDVLDALASPAVKSTAHRHLREIDLIAIAQAFAVADESDLPRLVDLSQRFVRRLEPPRPEEARFNQIQYHALQTGDVEKLQDLATFRAEGGLVGGSTARRSITSPWLWKLDYPGKPGKGVPKRLYEVPATSLSLRTMVRSVQRQEDRLDFQITAQIDHVRASRSDVVEVSLVNGIERMPLETTVHETIDMFGDRGPVGVSFGVSLEEIRALDHLVWPLRFEVTRRSQGVRRTRMLSGAAAGSPQYPQGAFIADDQYLQPGLTSGNVFCLHRVPFPAVVHAVSASSAELMLEGAVADPARTASIVVFRPGKELAIPAELHEGEDGRQHFRATLAATDLLAGESADDPFLHSATRRVAIRTEFGDLDLTWPDYDGDVVTLHDDVRVALTRSRFGIMALTHRPILPAVEHIELSDGVLEITGPHFGHAMEGTLTWRKYLPDSDDHVDEVLQVTSDAESFAARTELASLVPLHDLPTQPGGPAADYTLFFTDRHHETPLFTEPSALAALPLERVVDGRTCVVTNVAEGTRVQVR